MLTAGLFEDQAARFQFNENEIQLAQALLRSAIKSLAVTQIAWPKTISSIQVD
mgnify:CR=1 FL=1|tara:strand:- start:388 stop:546 length:159 start_codon:yes stop_codon:yes gene_type:complete